MLGLLVAAAAQLREMRRECEALAAALGEDGTECRRIRRTPHVDHAVTEYAASTLLASMRNKGQAPYNPPPRCKARAPRGKRQPERGVLGGRPPP